MKEIERSPSFFSYNDDYITIITKEVIIMINSIIYVFHTHLEIVNLLDSELFQIKKRYSKWDDVCHRYEPISYYYENNILYLPRGTDINKLASLLHTRNVVYGKREDKPLRIPKYEFKGTPKSSIQADATKFLLSVERFAGSDKYSQKGLNLDTGEGKTFATICNVINRQLRAMIIVDAIKLKKQWMNEFMKFSSITEDRLFDIDSSDTMIKLMNEPKLDYDVFFINHQTLSSYAKQYGWLAVRKFMIKLGIGIKVFDEAHLFFKNTLLIDFFSNCRFTIYLTATFGRSDKREAYLYNDAFANVYRFGEETSTYSDKVKHTIYIPAFFSSNIDIGELYRLTTNHGFSKDRYIEYVIKRDKGHWCLSNMLSLLDEALEREGKVLVIGTTIDSCEEIKKKIEKRFGKDLPVDTVHSKQKKSFESVIDNNRVIVSTVKSVGKGLNIPKLRSIINLEPIASKIIFIQLLGRLRRYNPDTDESTYFYDLIDTSIPRCIEFYDLKKPAIEKIVKDIQPINI